MAKKKKKSVSKKKKESVSKKKKESVSKIKKESVSKIKKESVSKIKKESVSKIKITLVKSVNRRTKQHRSCVSGLGLRRIGHSVIVDDTPEIRGMIDKAYYLLAVEEEA